MTLQAEPFFWLRLFQIPLFKSFKIVECICLVGLGIGRCIWYACGRARIGEHGAVLGRYFD